MKTTGSRASAVSQTRGFGDLLYDKAGARPSLDLDFAGTGSLRDKITGDHLVDHTRTTKGTYTNSEGLIKEAVINYQIKSQDFSTTPWNTTGLSVASTTETAPDGSPTATKYTPISGSSYFRVQQNGSQTVPGAGAYTISLHVKTQGYRYVHVRTGDSPSKEGRGFDLETETFFNGVYEGGQTYTQRSGTIQNLGDGWYRIAVHLQNFGSPTYILPYFSKSSTSVDLQGAASGDYIMTWGWQIEHGDTLNDYVKTGSTVNSAPRFTHEFVETGNQLASSNQFNLLASNQSSLRYGSINLAGGGQTASDLEPYAAVSPDGKYNAAKLTFNYAHTNGDQSFAYVVQNPTVNNKHVFSFYAKTISGTATIRIKMGNNGTTAGGGDFTVTDQWQRFERSGVASSGMTFFGISNHLQSQVGTSIYIWGFQLEEEQDTATTYVPSIDTFTSRASNATYVDSTGLVKTAHRNLIKYSESFVSTTPWVRSSFTLLSETTTAPDGSTIPWANLGSYIYQDGLFSGAGTYTNSVYLKAETPCTVHLRKTDDDNSNVAVNVTTEWQRFTTTGTKTSSGPSYTRLLIDNRQATTAGIVKIAIWGAQQVQGTEAGDYVKTEATHTGAARYSHDYETLVPTGLYLEPAATNLIKHNTDPSQSVWVKNDATILSETTTAPDGSSVPWIDLEDFIYQEGGSQSNGTTITSSIWVKAQSQNCAIGFNNPAGNVVTVDQHNSSTVWGSNRQKRIIVTTEWQRFEITDTVGSGSTGAIGRLLLDNRRSVSGSTVRIAIWGGQVELSPHATSTIITGSSTKTRAADVYTSTANITETIEPRGLLMERDVTNKAGKTESFDSGYSYQNCTFPVDNSVTNPDGSTGAIALTINAGNRSRGNYIGFNRGDNAYATQVVSLFVKKKTARYVLVGQGGATYYQQALFDFDTESIVTDPSISQNNGGVLVLVNRGVVKYPNGWFRIFLETSGATASNGAGISVVKDPATSKISASGNITYDGTEAVYIWGFNITDRPYLSSYIPNTTGTSAVTRSADVASISGDNFGTYRTNRVQKTLQDPFHTTADVFTRSSYAALAPDGTFSAQKVHITHNTQYLQTPNIMSPSIADGAAVTFSFYARTDTGVTVTAKTKMGRNGTENSFPTLTITDQWQRFQAVDTGNTIGNTKEFFGLIFSDASNVNKDIYIWGLQVEENGTGATNFIPSTDTFVSRLGNATYVDSNGLVKTAYRNYFTNSENFTSWTVNQGALSANSEIAPNGTQTADKYTPNNQSSNDHVVFQGTGSISGAQSIYVKSAGLSNLVMIGQGAHPIHSIVDFDIINGTIDYINNHATAKIEDAGNGWFRCIVYPTHNPVSFLVIAPHDGSVSTYDPFGRPTWTGNNTDGIYLWGAQLTDNPNDEGYYVKTEATATGGPRYSHDPDTLVPTGLYLEPATTNIAIKTHNFANTTGFSVNHMTPTREPAGYINPRGEESLGIGLLTENTVTSSHWIQSLAQIDQENVPYSMSVWVKPLATDRDMQLRVNGIGNNTARVRFDLQNGTVKFSYGNSGTTPSGRTWTMDNPTIEKYQNGWYRLQLHNYRITGGLSGSHARFVLYSHRSDASNGEADTFEGSGQAKFLVWGIQIEENSTRVTSYIENKNTSQLTRAADTYTSTDTTVFDRDGGNKEALWSPTANTMFGQMIYNRETEYPRLYEFNSPNGEALTIFMEHGTNKVNGRMSTEAGLQYTDTVGNATHNTSVKLATTCQLNDAITAIDGSLGTQDTSVALHVLPTDNKRPTSVNIGDRIGGDRHANAPIQRITHWKTRLPDASLINITT